MQWGVTSRQQARSPSAYWSIRVQSPSDSFAASPPARCQKLIS